MKTIIKFTVVFAVMFTSLITSAKEIKLNVLGNTVNKTLEFTIDVPTSGSRIVFLDSAEKVMYTENVLTSDAYVKRFDLKNLEVGSYILKVESELSTTLYDIVVASNSVSVSKESVKVKPVFRKTVDMVYLNFLNLDKEDIELKIYDSENRLVHKETFADMLLVEKALNFTNAVKDSYTIVVADANRVFYESFIVD